MRCDEDIKVVTAQNEECRQSTVKDIIVLQPTNTDGNNTLQHNEMSQLNFGDSFTSEGINISGFFVCQIEALNSQARISSLSLETV